MTVTGQTAQPRRDDLQQGAGRQPGQGEVGDVSGTIPAQGGPAARDEKGRMLGTVRTPVASGRDAAGCNIASCQKHRREEARRVGVGGVCWSPDAAVH